MKIIVTSEQKWILTALTVFLLAAIPSFFMTPHGVTTEGESPEAAKPAVGEKGDAIPIMESKWTPRAMNREELKSLQEGLKIDINHADKEELGSLPGVGAASAQAIIDYRESNGCFESVDDLKNVKGFGGGAKVETLKDHVRLEMSGCVVKSGDGASDDDGGRARGAKSKRGKGKKSSSGDVVNINTADIKELDGLPGIGKSTAQKIIDYRSEHGSFGSIEELMEVPGIKQGTFDKIKDLVTAY